MHSDRQKPYFETGNNDFDQQLPASRAYTLCKSEPRAKKIATRRQISAYNIQRNASTSVSRYRFSVTFATFACATGQICPLAITRLIRRLHLVSGTQNGTLQHARAMCYMISPMKTSSVHRQTAVLPTV